MALSRLFTFTGGTVILSSQVNPEFNQLVETLSGVLNTKDVIILLSDAIKPPLTLNQTGTGDLIRVQKSGTNEFKVNNKGDVISSAGNNVDVQTSVGVLDSSVTQFLSVGAVETDLYSRTILANTLDAEGDFLRITGSGFTTPNANLKQIRLYYGGVVFFDTGAIAVNGKPWIFNTIITRDAPTTHFQMTSFAYEGGFFINSTRSGASGNPTASNVFKVTGQGVANNDINMQQCIIERGGKRS